MSVLLTRWKAASGAACEPVLSQSFTLPILRVPYVPDVAFVASVCACGARVSGGRLLMPWVSFPYAGGLKAGEDFPGEVSELLGIVKE